MIRTPIKMITCCIALSIITGDVFAKRSMIRGNQIILIKNNITIAVVEIVKATPIKIYHYTGLDGDERVPYKTFYNFDFKLIEYLTGNDKAEEAFLNNKVLIYHDMQDDYDWPLMKKPLGKTLIIAWKGEDLIGSGNFLYLSSEKKYLNLPTLIENEKSPVIDWIKDVLEKNSTPKDWSEGKKYYADPFDGKVIRY